MKTSARILRARIDEAPGPQRYLSSKEIDRRDRILQAGCLVLAEFGRHTISMASFALGLGLSPGSIRRLFPDLDNLLGEIIRRHLRAACSAVCAVPYDLPDRAAAQRAAYLAITRTGLGAPVEAQLLLLDRRLLPPDERASVEAARDSLADILGGANGALVLNLLDMAALSPAQIEATIAALVTSAGPASHEEAAQTLPEMAHPNITETPLAPAASPPQTEGPVTVPEPTKPLPPPWRPGPQKPRPHLPEGARHVRPEPPPGKSLYHRALASLP